MSSNKSDLRVIVSGGGTGGHIFPAISIANAIREIYPSAEILFVGAQGKMEMEKVPAAGYTIIGLPVAGFQRRFTLKNLTFIFKLAASMLKAYQVVSKFKPHVVVGVGGYASGPLLRVATAKGIPALIQEQNSYPGVTNKILSKKVQSICVAYEGMEKFFPANKIILTGNPVRQNLSTKVSRSEAADFFGLDEHRAIVLVIGGSLGARSINKGVLAGIDTFLENGVQVIWQTGKYYFGEMEQALSLPIRKKIKVYDFLLRMDLAYALADVIVSRAGASSISEIALLGKPVILVPSPNVAEDHQTKNAMALVANNAAVLIPDNETQSIAQQAITLLKDTKKLREMSSQILKMAKPNACQDIANEVLRLANRKKAMQFNTLTHIYFIGIGGIGMSALARFFKSQNRIVAGYDRTPTDLTKQLVYENIEVIYNDSIDAYPINKLPIDSTLVVYTPAVPQTHEQLIWFQQQGFTIMKRAQVLGLVSEGLNSICIAGTHGKTTVSTLTAHLLKQSSIDCHAFIGGISKNYQTNYLTSNHSNWIVLEADEYDRSFLHLKPQMAVITSADADHLDIYGDSKNVTEAFEQYLGKVKDQGIMVIKKGLALNYTPTSLQKKYSYALNSEADYFASNINLKDGFYTFTLNTPQGPIDNLTLGVPGLLNIENAVAASAMALLAGALPSEIKTGLATFTGIKRRFDYWIKEKTFCLIDDYAHHPEEINATAKSVKAIYPDKKIAAVFQPHLFSRTSDFYKEFAAALSQFDKVFLLDIYPARELPKEGINSQLIANHMTCPVEVVSKDEIATKLIEYKPDVAIAMGAGDIDLLLPSLKTTLLNTLLNN